MLAELHSNGRVSANRLRLGGVAERLIAPVLKTGRPNGLVSSNLTPSASLVGRERQAKSIPSPHNKAAEIHPCPPLSALVRDELRPQRVSVSMRVLIPRDTLSVVAMRICNEDRSTVRTQADRNRAGFTAPFHRRVFGKRDLRATGPRSDRALKVPA